MRGAWTMLLAAAVSAAGVPAGAETARVTGVVDGDTIVVEEGLRVQLIGVDALGGTEGARGGERERRAAAFTAAALRGRTVRLESDPANSLKGHRDAWGRRLAYVYVGEELFNRTLIERGFASAYVKYPFRRRDEFVAAQERARASRRGLWALPEPGAAARKEAARREIYFGDRRSRLYHRASCLRVANIPESDRVRFHEEQEALKLGYRPGRLCLPVLMRRF